MLGDEPGLDTESYSWSKSHLRADREEICSKVSYRHPVRAGCGSARTMLNKPELQVFHTVVANIEME